MKIAGHRVIGTVGSGVVEVLDVNQKLIATRAKEED